MKDMKKIILLIFSLLIAATMIVALSNNKKAVHIEKAQEVLTMGVSLDYPPFEFLSYGNPQGYDIDLAYMLASELDFMLEIKDMDFNSLIPALTNKQVDFVISAMSITPERANNVSFSQNYYTTKPAFLTKSPPDTFELKDQKIGVQLGSTMELIAKQLKINLPSIELISLTRVPVLIEELKVGRMDGVLLEEEVASQIQSKDPSFNVIKMEKYNYGNSIVFAHDSPLIERFNQAIDKLREESKLKQLEDKWLSSKKNHVQS